MRRFLPPHRAKTARRGSRLIAVTALVILLVAAFVLTDGITARAASNPGNLTLGSVGNPLVQGYQGCPLGPAYTFCDQPPGTISQSAPFFITSSVNVTGLAASLQAIPGLSANFAASDFSIVKNACTGNLAPSGQCEIDVQFSPSTTGLRQAALVVTDAQGDSLSINVEGTGKNLGLTPPYGASPAVADSAFNFGRQTVNTTSVPQPFTVTAGAALSGISFSLAPIPGLESEFTSSPQPDFSFTSNCSALAAGGTCTASIAFAPGTASVGLRSAALTATDAQGDSTTVYISGYGQASSQAPALEFTFAGASASSASCARLNYFGFCSEPVGGVSPLSTVFSIQNNSASQVTGLSVPKASVIAQGATAPDFTVQNTSCSSVLAASATCNITVAFTPTKGGLRQGAIAVTDVQGDTATVNVAGYGDDYNVATQLPMELSVIPGNSVTFDATLTPDNAFGMNGEQVTFVCPTDLPANTSCVATPCPAAITPGTPVNLQVKLATSSAKVVVPVPTSGCSSYGPAVSAFIAAPPFARHSPPPAARDSSVKSAATSSAVFVLSVTAAMGLLLLSFSALASRPRQGTALIILCAGFAAAILTGCHHHGAVVTTATPNATTTLTVLGNAVDANGNSLNASRQFQITLDVVSK